MYIDLYSNLFSYNVGVKQPIVTKAPEEVSVGLPLVEDAKEITLAQYEPVTKDVITAHNLKDYRSKSFNMMLLPKMEVLFDKFLEGCNYYAERLNSTSPYS